MPLLARALALGLLPFSVCLLRDPAMGQPSVPPDLDAAAQRTSPGTTEPNTRPPASASALSPPKLEHYEPAQLPASKRIEEPTFVDLRLEIDTHGKVRSAQAQGSPDPVLAQAAEVAARRFSFVPARQGGTPIPVVIEYRFWFEATQKPSTTDDSHSSLGSQAAKEQSATKSEAQSPTPPIDQTPVERRSPTATTPRTNGPQAAAPEDEVYEAVAKVEAPPREPTKRALKKQILTRVPGTRGDAIKAIELLPGVARTSNGNNPVIRGSSPSESIVLLDGTLVPFLYHFGGLTSFVHPQLIGEVDLYPGNFSSRYGRATGGVVEAHLRAPKSVFSSVANVSFVDSSLLVEGPITDRLKVATAVRRSNIDFVFNNFAPDGVFNVVVAPLYWDYQSIAQYDFSDDSFLRFAAFGSRDQMELLFDDPTSEDSTLRGTLGVGIEFHRFQTLHQTKLGKVKQRAQLTLGLQNLQQNFGPNSTAYFDIYEYNARAEWTIPIDKQAQVIAGLDIVQQRLDGAYRGSVASSSEGAPDLPDNARDQVSVNPTTINSFSPAAYVEARLFPAPGLLLIPGLRFDYYSQLGHSTINPRFSQRYSITDSTTLTSGLGWYSQPPLYYEAFKPIGNPNLEPYHAIHSSLGVEQQLSEGLRFDVEGFYKRLYNRVVGTEGGLPPRFVNNGKGRIVGLETGVTLNPSEDFYGQLSYTLSRSERQDLNQAWRLFDYDQTHVLSVAASYSPFQSWEFGARFRYVTGNPLTPIVDSSFDAATGTYYPVFGALNSRRNPAFNRLDVRVQKTFRIGPGTLAAYLDIQNVYAANNPQGYTYSYDYQRKESSNISPFFPNLGVRGEL